MSEGRRVEIADLYEFRFPSAPLFSTDGDSVVFVVQQAHEATNSYQSYLWLYNRSTSEARQLTSAGSDSSPVWLPNGRLLFVSRRPVPGTTPEKPKKPTTSFFSIDPTGGEAVHEFTIERPVSWIRPLPDGRFVVLSGWERDPLPELQDHETRVHAFDEAPIWSNGTGFTHTARSRLGVFSQESGDVADLTPEEYTIRSASLSPDGASVVLTAARFGPLLDPFGLLFLLTLAEPDTLVDLGATTGLSQQAFGPTAYVDDRTIAVMHADQAAFGLTSTASIYVMPSGGGKARLLDGDTTKRIGGSTIGSDARLGGSARGPLQVAGEAVYYAATSGYVADLFRAEIDGSVACLTAGDGSVDAFAVHHDDRGTVFAYTALRGNSLPELFLRDSDGNRAITSLNQEYADRVDVAPVAHMTVASNDAEIDAWVLLPPESAGDSVPAILDIHGGPRTAYGEIFFHEMQIWAARGFAVVFCNPHGSDGRGDEFADIRGRYGTLDYEDILASLDAALDAYPRIDRQRVCITGGSYGGYMTNWAIGHTDRFVAAASQRSIANWPAFWGTSDIGYFFANDQLDATPWSDPSRFWQQSPLAHADRATTPTLFIHSDADHRCWIQDAIQMHTALCYHGVKSRLVWIEGENHELSRSGKPLARIRRLEEITAWFEQHTGLASRAE